MASAASASERWASDVRDLSDPVGYIDFANQPGLTHQRIVERIRQERFPLPADVFPLPKGDSGYRRMAWLDPLDDIALRVLVGRLTLPIHKGLFEGTVYSYPFARTGPGWEYVSYTEANKRRRADGQALLEDERCRALGTIDIENYYGNIDPCLLVKQLVDLGCPQGAVRALVGALRVLNEASGLCGIPVGFEGSGALGNVYLLDADKTAAAQRLGLIRYTDDTWLFLRDAGDWQYALGEYVSRLDALNLRLNLRKTRLQEKGWDDPSSVISHGLLDSVTQGNTRTVSADEAIEMLTCELDNDEPDARLIAFAMGSLRGKRDTRAIQPLREHPELFHNHPKMVGDYLTNLAKDQLSQRAIDREWIADVATTFGGPSTLAAQLQACRVASSLHTGAKVGKRLYELARANTEPNQVPLHTWAAFAWAHSEDWKPARAAEAARDHGTLSLRRAFLLGFKHRDSSRQAKRLFSNLERFEPDLAPTLAFVAS